MAGVMKSQMGQYWLLYYQPVPESGERIAAGLILLEPGRRPKIKYDASFKKVRSVFPSTDVETLAFTLQCVSEQLERADAIDSTLQSLGPQLVTSAARSIVSPISTAVLDRLTERYLLPEKKKRASRTKPDVVSKQLESFVRSSIPPSLQFHTNVSAKDILGTAVSGAKRIALAVPLNGQWALIDGVDLNQLTPKEAEERAHTIANTYWSYHRAATQTGVSVKRVGIVLNGNSHLAPETLEAHDYALHRFQADSDLAIDAAQPDSGAALNALLVSMGKP